MLDIPSTLKAEKLERLPVVDFLNKALPYIRIIFPEQRRWLVRVFVGAGVAAALGPYWEPYVIALAKRYLDVQVPTGAPQITGWVLLFIGLAIYVRNEYVDHKAKPTVERHEDRTDRKMLVSLFSQIHLPSIDQFVDFGKTDAVYMPALHYFYGLEGHMQSSTFFIHDAQIKELVEALYKSLGGALSHGVYFRSTANEDLKKFDSRHLIGDNPGAEQAHEDFISSIHATERDTRALCGAVRKKFPDFDFTATNAAALVDYRSYNEVLKP
ncbi:hypothetical protein D3C71_1442570 [compost metagenome]